MWQEAHIWFGYKRKKNKSINQLIQEKVHKPLVLSYLQIKKGKEISTKGNIETSHSGVNCNNLHKEKKRKGKKKSPYQKFRVLQISFFNFQNSNKLSVSECCKLMITQRYHILVCSQAVPSPNSTLKQLFHDMGHNPTSAK